MIVWTAQQLWSMLAMQADIALGGLLNGSMAAMRAKTHAFKSQLKAASLTIKVRSVLNISVRIAGCPVHERAIEWQDAGCSMNVFNSMCAR